LHAFLSSPLCATCPIHPILLHFINLYLVTYQYLVNRIHYGAQHAILSSAVTSSLSGSSIFFSTLLIGEFTNYEDRLLASSRQTIRLQGTTLLQLNGLSWNMIHEEFFENLSNCKVSLKSNKNNGYFTWTLIYIFLLYLAQFCSEWEISQTKFVGEINTHILHSITFFKWDY
jgi:hypothetical protein